jgi:hypothetical protein
VGVGRFCVISGDRSAVVVGRHRRIPAAVLLVSQPTAQRGQAGVDERPARRVAEDLGQGEDVHHPAGDPELDRAVQQRLAVVVEPGEAAVRVRTALGEVDERRGLADKELEVGLGETSRR